MLSDRENAVFTNYDNLLAGHCRVINSHNFYPPTCGEANEKLAVQCIRHAVQDILGWTPEQALVRFQKDTIREMKLERLVHYIRFPAEVCEDSPRYVLSRMYPDLLPLSEDRLTELLYISVRTNGKESMGGMLKRYFPPGYFVGSGSPQRFAKCLAYVVRHDTEISTMDELYAFFLSPAGTHLLVRKGLKVPAHNHPSTMADILRGMTKDVPGSEAYYQKWLFLSALPPEDRPDPFTGADPLLVNRRGKSLSDRT